MPARESSFMRRPYLLLHIAVVLAGFTGVFGKLISLNEGLLTWYRVFFSWVILFIVLKLFRVSKAIRFGDKFEIVRVGTLITIHWVFFYASIKYSNISVGVVCYCLTGFFTAIFKPLISRTRLRISELLLSTLTLLGIALIFHFDTSHQLGITLGAISAALAALYTLYNERLVRRFDSKLITYYQMMGGTLVLGMLLPAYLYFFPAERLVPGWEDTAYLLLLASFCTVGLYVIFAEVLKSIPAFTVNLTFNLEPIYAVIIAFLFFGESKEVNISFYAGLFLVLLSVALQTLISVGRGRSGIVGR